MKQLLILRHAKSSWKDADLEDHERPLSKRGKRDASRMGQLLRGQGLVPQFAISSTAKRARVTLEHLLEAVEVDCEVRLAPELYMAGPGEIIDLLRRLPDRYTRAMVVGHNPGLEKLIEVLTGETVVLPTAALAWVDCGCRRWREIDSGEKTTLLQLWRPKELTDESSVE